MALRSEINAVADVLADPTLFDCSPEQVAEVVIKTLDEKRAASHRLAVLANVKWWPDDESRLVVIGPFSTRATKAAEAVGSAMAGTPAGGSGKWLLVPAYANARAAWDALKPPPEKERRMAAFLERVRASKPNNPSVWGPLSTATCCCGVKPGGFCLVHKKRSDDA